jgi:hypothetical protein
MVTAQAGLGRRGRGQPRWVGLRGDERFVDLGKAGTEISTELVGGTSRSTDMSLRIALNSTKGKILGEVAMCVVAKEAGCSAGGERNNQVLTSHCSDPT